MQRRTASQWAGGTAVPLPRCPSAAAAPVTRNALPARTRHPHRLPGVCSRRQRWSRSLGIESRPWLDVRPCEPLPRVARPVPAEPIRWPPRGRRATRWIWATSAPGPTSRGPATRQMLQLRPNAQSALIQFHQPPWPLFLVATPACAGHAVGEPSQAMSGATNNWIRRRLSAVEAAALSAARCGRPSQGRASNDCGPIALCS